MTITELIFRLDGIRAEHGDLEVRARDGGEDMIVMPAVVDSPAELERVGLQRPYVKL